MRRVRMDSKRAVALALAAAALGGIVSVADGAGGVGGLGGVGPSTGGAADAVRAADAAADRAARAQALAWAHVGALRDGRPTAADALPAQIADGPLADDGMVDVASARKVRDDGGGAWLARSSDGASICAIARGGMTCPPVGAVVERGVVPGWVWRKGDPIHLFGVVRDGVVDVALRMRDGSSRSVTVAGNFFAVDVDVLPASIDWIGPDGRGTFAFPEMGGRPDATR